MQVRRWLGVLAVAGLALGACGGDDDDAGDGDLLADLEEQFGDVPDDDRSSEQLAADAALAEAALLTLDDLPEGWDATAPEDDEDDGAMPPGLVDCLGLPEELGAVMGSDEDEDPTAVSDDFALGETTTASVEISVHHVPEVASATLVLFGLPEFEKCFQQAMRTELLGSMETDGVELEVTELNIRITDPPALGDEAVGLRFDVAIAIPALDEEIRSIGDLWMVRVDRSLATFAFQEVGGRFDEALALELGGIVVSRLEGEV